MEAMPLTPNQKYYLKYKERMQAYYLKNKNLIREKQKIYYQERANVVNENKFKIIFHGPSKISFD